MPIFGDDYSIETSKYFFVGLANNYQVGLFL